jgi:lipopolysaccharide transport system ATP-binding protein
MAEYAVQVRGLAKSYKIGNQTGKQYNTLQDAIVRRARRLVGRGSPETSQRFWALQDISFNVRPGEALGIIGRNGAGKSTLLKLLARITPPTRGSADVYGRMGSLLEVGTGFHPELTGRENIFLNGAILGMTRADIRRRFDEIVAFAETERFLDMPVKRYSSGMYMRLAFAVAAHLEPEILVVDEVLSVGDVAFQAKSLSKMGDVARSGRTVLFVSHNLGAVTQLCQTGMLLDRGGVVAYGTAEAIVSRHLLSANREGKVDLEARPAAVDSPAYFTFAELRNSEGDACQHFPLGSDIGIAFGLRIANERTDVRVSMSITASDGLAIAHIVDDDSKFHLPMGKRDLSMVVTMPDVRLYPGAYSVTLWVSDAVDATVYDHADDCLTFNITDGGQLTLRPLPRSSGLLFMTPDWTVQ